VCKGGISDRSLVEVKEGGAYYFSKKVGGLVGILFDKFEEGKKWHLC